MFLPLLLHYMVSENAGTVKKLLVLELHCENESDSDEDLVVSDSNSDNDSDGNEEGDSAKLLTKLRRSGITRPHADFVLY